MDVKNLGGRCAALDWPPLGDEPVTVRSEVGPRLPPVSVMRRRSSSDVLDIANEAVSIGE